MYHAVFFDIDNTLLDTQAALGAAVPLVFADLSLPCPENAVEVFFRENDRLWARIEKGELTQEDHRRLRWPTIFAALGLPDVDFAAFEEAYRVHLYQHALPMPHARELLESLQGKCRLFAASNAADAARQRLRLEKAGLADKLEGVFLSQELGACKPDPAFFAACFSQLKGLAPQHCLMVGDSLSADIAGGAAYGLDTCLFDPYHRTPSCPQATWHISDLRQVEPLVTG